jgi:hypothetical protein
MNPYHQFITTAPPSQTMAANSKPPDPYFYLQFQNRTHRAQTCKAPTNSQKLNPIPTSSTRESLITAQNTNPANQAYNHHNPQTRSAPKTTSNHNHFAQPNPKSTPAHRQSLTASLSVTKPRPQNLQK